MCQPINQTTHKYYQNSTNINQMQNANTNRKLNKNLQQLESYKLAW